MWRPPLEAPVRALTTAVPASKIARFAYVANFYDSTVSIYQVDAETGLLSPNGYATTGIDGGAVTVTVDPSGRFAYVPNESDGTLSAFTINQATGALLPVAGSPFAAGIQPISATVEPSGHYLYATDFGTNTILAYAIDPGTGALAALPGPAPATGAGPLAVTVDPSGRFAFVANQNSNDVSAYVIVSGAGTLMPVPGSPFAAGTIPKGVAVDPSGRFVYVPNLGGGISAYTIDSGTGVLSPVPGSPFHAGPEPFSITVDPTGRFAYATLSGAGVLAFSINGTTGALTLVPGSPFAAGTDPWTVTVAPSGHFAYVANFTSNTVTAFGIDAGTGALTAIGTVASRAGPYSFTLAPGTPVTFSPQFAFVTNSGSNNVSAYTIVPGTGALAPVTGSPFTTGGSPQFVAVDPSGRYAYIANTTSNNVSAYTITPGTGVLVPVDGSPFAAGVFPSSIAIDPSGQFAYVVNSALGNVSAYTITAGTGALVPVGGAPMAAGSGAWTVTVDPSGRFVYVANASSNNVSAYTITPGTGALVPVHGSPFAAGAGANSVTVDPTGQFAYVANYGDGTVSAFSITVGTGVLVPVGGSPVLAGTHPWSVTADPTGRFIYVTNFDSANVSAYTITPGTGALVPVDGSPFAAGSRPISVSVDPTGRFAYVADYSSMDVVAYSITAQTGALVAVSGSPYFPGMYPWSVATTRRTTVLSPVDAEARAPSSVPATGPGGGSVTLDGTLSNDPNGLHLTYSWTFGGQVIGTDAVLSTVLPLGRDTVTLTVTDFAGLSSSQTFTVYVVDQDPPVISNVPPPIGVEQATLNGTPVVLPWPQAVDAVEGPVPVTAVSAPPGVIPDGTSSGGNFFFPLGLTTIYFSATDQSGNRVTASTTVNVVDTTPPVLMGVQPSIVVPPSRPGGAVLALTPPTATDLCDARPVVSATGIPDGNIFPAGTTKVTWTATDHAGNTASAVTLVTVGLDLWTRAQPMLEGRESHTATLLADGRVLVTGGIGPNPETELFDPLTGAWTFSGMMNTPRWEHTATRLPDGRILVAGGYDGTGATPNTEIFDPTGSQWTPALPMNVARRGHTASLLANGKVLVVGGITGSGNQTVASAEVYDPILGRWDLAGSMSSGRVSHVMTVLTDGRVLAAGGYDSSINTDLSSADIYDPSANSWSPALPMSVAREIASASLLPNGQVLVAGGQVVGVDTRSTEVFDPTTGKWLPAAPMLTARHLQVSLNLPDGRLLLAGGADQEGNILAEVELYDPVADQWSVASPMIISGVFLQGTVLADGRVFLTGGRDAQNGPENQAQVYPTLQAAFANVPGTVTVQGAPPGAIVPLTPPTATLLGSPAVVTNNAPAVFPGGVTIVTWYVTDQFGHVTTATTTVIVQGPFPPIISNMLDSIVVEQASPTGSQVFISWPVAADIWGTPVPVMGTADRPGVIPGGETGQDSYFFFPPGKTTVTFSATDQAGNVGTAQTIVTVQDTTPPQFVPGLPPPLLVAQTGPEGAVVVTIPSPHVVDVADPNPSIQVSGVPPGNLFPPGDTVITWTATDASGNVSTITQAVTVRVELVSISVTPSNPGILTSQTQAFAATGIYSDGSTQVFPPSGALSFGSPLRLPAGNLPNKVVAADFNRDGLLDLAVTNYNDGTASIFLATAPGVFGPPTTVSVGVTPSDLAVADMNRDGKLDLVVPHFSQGNFSILFGSGTGTFAAGAGGSAGGQNPVMVAVGDFNRDGLPDLAFSQTVEGVVRLIGNLGNNQFATRGKGFVQSRPLYFAMADLNRDGNLDFLVPNSNSGTVSVVLGQGNFLYSTVANLPVGNGPSSVAAGDFNGDGVLDFAVTNHADNTVSVALGLGGATFGPPVTYPTGAGPLRITAADLNGDGYLDLIIAEDTGRSLEIYLGHGDGTFGERITLPLGGQPGGIAVADLDRDGKLDIAVPTSDGSVSVYFNTTPSILATWSSSAPSVAPISLLGTATGTSDGTTTIQARVGSITGSTTLTVTSTPSSTSLANVSLSYGPSESLVVTVTSSTGTPDGGTVTLTVNNQTFTAPLVQGQATFNLGGLNVGSYPVSVSYSGGGTFGGSSATTSLTVSPTPATLILGNLSQTYTGSPLPVTVATNPAGVTGVTVSYAGSPTPPTNAGSYAVTASLTNPNYVASPVSGTLIVAQAPQTIAFGPLQGVTYGAAPIALAGTASSGLPIAYTVLSGPATVSGSTLTLTGAGPVSLQAAQGGNGNYLAAAPVTQSLAVAPAVTTVALASSAAPSVVGQSLTLTATVQTQIANLGAVAGSVQFTLDGATLGTPVAVSGGAATYPGLVPALGTHTIGAAFTSTNPNHANSAGTFSQTVTPALSNTTVLISPPGVSGHSTYGQTINLSATVTVAAPGATTISGTVQFTEDGNPLGNPVTVTVAGSTGTAALSGVNPPAGTHQMGAVFSSTNASLQGGSATPTPQTVAMAQVNMTFTLNATSPSVYSQPLTLTASLKVASPGAGTIAGTVQFTQDSANLGNPVSVVKGAASLAGVTPLPGNHQFAATFVSSDPSMNGAAGSLPQTVSVASTTTTLQVSPSGAPLFGTPLKLTASVAATSPGTGIPQSGSVVFTANGAPISGPVPLVNGIALFSPPNQIVFNGGANPLVAAFSSTDPNFTGSSGSLTETITPLPTTVTITPPSQMTAGKSATFTITVAAVPANAIPTGKITVSLNSGAPVSLTLDGSGSATFTGTLTTGKNTIQATYAATTNFAGSSAKLTTPKL
jgi:6-phosphogluconolactonase (cycloisomerase 2 family)